MGSTLSAGSFTFVSECVMTNVTAEWFCSCVLSVVIIKLRLGLEALRADVAHKLALARVELRMPPEQGWLVKAFVAARMLTSEWLHQNLILE